MCAVSRKKVTTKTAEIKTKIERRRRDLLSSMTHNTQSLS